MLFEKEKLHCDIIHILSAEELMLLIGGVGEDSWESLGLPGDQTSLKGNQPWIFIGRTDAEAEAPILCPSDVKSQLIGKDPDAGKDWRKAGGEGDKRGWDSWMALLTQWTWVWTSSGRWWRTGKSDVLQSVGWQRVRDAWTTEQQQWWNNKLV